MKKAILIIFLLFIFIWIWLWYYYFFIQNNNYNNNILNQEINIEKEKNLAQEINNIKNEEIIKIEDKKTQENDEIKKVIKTQENTQEDEDKKRRIEILKKRIELKWIIKNAEEYLNSNQNELALKEYIKAYKDNPNDEKIISKIAYIYFDLKIYNQAISYFDKIKNLNETDKKTYLLANLYKWDYKTNEWIIKLSDKIKELITDEEERFYYLNALHCSINFHECKKSFENYLSKKEPTFDKLIDIKQSIKNYNDFKINDLYYKDALLIWSFYKSWLYNLSIKLASNLLKEKPDYKPMLIIIWNSAYKLNDIKTAKNYLIKYYSLEPTNSEISYILWNINYLEKDYITSTLYYNRALKNWFQDKHLLLKKLLYNYYLQEDKRSMLNIFDSLLKEEKSTITDFSLWIYNRLINGKNELAKLRSETALKKFEWKKWSEIFYWYLWWVYREKQDIEKANELIDTWLKINSLNPLLTLNKRYILEMKKDFLWAKIFIKKTIILNWDWEFGLLAKRELEAIEKYLEKNKNNISFSWSSN